MCWCSVKKLLTHTLWWFCHSPGVAVSGFQWSVLCSVDVVLPAVINVQATVLSSSSVRVTWQDAPRNSSALIVAYSVHFFPTFPRQPEVQQVVTTTSDTLRNLRPNTEYVIYVTAYAYRGKSEPSQAVTARTFVKGTSTLPPLVNTFFQCSVIPLHNLR